MSDQARWQSFVTSIGGRQALEALIRQSVQDPEHLEDPELWEELAVLYESNVLAREQMQQIAAEIAEQECADPTRRA